MYANDPNNPIDNAFNWQINDYNPYQSPEAIPDDEPSMKLLDEPNYLPASSGVDWIKQAWQIFMMRPLFWVGIGLCYITVVLVASLLPLLNVFVTLFNMMLLAGVAYVAYLTDMGEEASISDLFAGFKQSAMPLLILFLLSLVCVAVIVIPVAVVVGLIGVGISDIGNLSWLIIAFVVLSILLLTVPLMMAMFFSPILVFFHEMRPIDAMKLSFKACMRNILPFLVYALLMIFINILATIPLGLGHFVVLPMTLIAIYVAYKQILLA